MPVKNPIAHLLHELIYIICHTNSIYVNVNWSSPINTRGGATSATLIIISKRKYLINKNRSHLVGHQPDSITQAAAPIWWWTAPLGHEFQPDRNSTRKQRFWGRWETQENPLEGVPARLCVHFYQRQLQLFLIIHFHFHFCRLFCAKVGHWQWQWQWQWTALNHIHPHTGKYHHICTSIYHI